ncbi:uncharacterized protein LOC111025198 [Momordica charantia]|uniref:Uncharacterized protein LOC111025198 n=1 Tax=Momordica charantia TaxID=3673 RepID=A0A6J1DWY4_MOMCH|nr:uncharacterized protein LOC111025198 [Momordica charantia]
MHEANAIATPMISGSIVSARQGDSLADPYLYRSIVGALQYVTLTRPEISYAVNKTCQFMHAPTMIHSQLVKQILRYLKGTFDNGLLLTKPTTLTLQGYSYADWASDPDDRKSTSGFCIYLGNNPISWGSKKQAIISRSSTEAEYRALALAASKLIWLKTLFSELRILIPNPLILWCDNLSSVHLSANPVLHSRTKHVEIDIYFIRDLVIYGKLRVQHLPSCANRRRSHKTFIIGTISDFENQAQCLLTDKHGLAGELKPITKIRFQFCGLWA